MQRDWDLIRTILIEVDKGDGSEMWASHFGEHAPLHVSKHMNLLIDAGFCDGWQDLSMQGDASFLTNLTYSGQEFLDAIYDHSIWSEVSLKVKQKQLHISFEVLKQYANHVAMEMLVD